MTYRAFFTSRFKKDVKRCERSHFPMDEMDDLIARLTHKVPLEIRHRDHALQGDYLGTRDCHIRPDWLLLYKISAKDNTITFTRTGSHAEIFGS